MGATRHGGAPSAVHEQPTAGTPSELAADAHLRVVRGAPGAEEVAALAAVFAALAQGARRGPARGPGRPRVSWDHPGPGRAGALGYRAPGSWTS
ncbi:acyl-CoA carboxylase epsilon subunit [Streptomyces buecherae]|uniref:acyl-CoA carboxylase epsilon subunit n=1 Tax=Streptomyces buecherae TaxID=2763006 RepID=UPI00164DCCDC|nr:acyl-CoA carboxylase epsilon subunit [Streptomyces buecherae]MBC3990949.1 acyl-CoA carboxylase subunit epsilon [Streptomyces buecherae]